MVSGRPEDVTKNVFYWSRVAAMVAQGCGMHRSVKHSQLPHADKWLWKRIWWTLFTRDRSVAVAVVRPTGTNIEDSDVEMVSEDDFIDDEEPAGTAAAQGDQSEFAPDPIHVRFFLNYVKLCEIMSLVLAQQHSVASKSRRNDAIDLTHSDMALADWLQCRAVLLRSDGSRNVITSEPQAVLGIFVWTTDSRPTSSAGSPAISNAEWRRFERMLTNAVNKSLDERQQRQVTKLKDKIVVITNENSLLRSENEVYMVGLHTQKNNWKRDKHLFGSSEPRVARLPRSITSQD
ncbi:Transcriptional activator of fatty acid utilization [Elasticomyces elasticus]|nr:Transcriptional activator of fatty acid utilization [Elasticomyces elasticus]